MLLTFDVMAQAYLEDYVLQRYRTMNTSGRASSTRAYRWQRRCIQRCSQEAAWDY
jgi:hypothetical protein